MDQELDLRVSPSLHPENVTTIDGYSETTAPYVSGTKQVLHEAYSGVSKVYAAREAANKDPTLNDAGRIIKTDDMARRAFQKLAKLFDTERGNVVRAIAHIEAQLSAPIQAKASHPLASEVRAFVLAMPAAERVGFIRAAILKGDDATATSAIGAPAYLSGIDDNMRAVLLRTYHEHNAPEEAAKLQVMKGAQALLENRGGLLFGQLEAAVGAKPHEVKKLREAKAQSDRAFAV